ncbi:MAG: thiamine phosphate synthase [Guyparkeria sp.]
MNGLDRVDIVLGVLREPSGRVWAEIRPEGAHLAGALAFPGGKRRDGESLRDALRRELAEECGVEVCRARRLMEVAWEYPDRHLRLIAYEVTHWRGEPRGCEGQRIVRRTLDAAARPEWLAAMPPANRGLVNALVLPRCMAITSPASAGESAARWMTRVAAGLADLPASLIVNLRPGGDLSLSPGEWRDLAQVVSRAGHWPIVNPAGGAALPGGLPAGVGVHLNHARLMNATPATVESWQKQGRPVTAAVHDRVTLGHANDLAVDLATVSPVKATATHPDAAGIGWAAFADLAARARMPVLALGGLTIRDLPRAWRRGGHGIASISAFW